MSKRCCILCDGPNYCLGDGSEKREVFDTLEEAISGVAKKKARDEHDVSIPVQDSNDNPLSTSEVIVNHGLLLKN